MDDDSTVRIAIVDNAIEAGLLDEILEERDIPHILRCFHDSAYDGLFQTQKGWGAVMAPEEYRAEVEELLHHIRNSLVTDEEEEE